MSDALNVRELAKVRANVRWLSLYDPTCPRQLDGHDGRPSLDPVKWGKIKCVDGDMITGVGLTALSIESYIGMHCIYGLVLSMFRWTAFGVAIVAAIYRVWHFAGAFGVLFLATFTIPRVFGRKKLNYIPSKRKEL